MLKFCTLCGQAVVHRIPDGDTHTRAVCGHCHHVHYENPKIVVGCVATWRQRILICKRAIEPRAGFWTLPAGFMELNESCRQGASRETAEEACATIDPASLKMLGTVDVVRANQVHIFFYGELERDDHRPGEESLETALVTLDEVPWQALAFRSVTWALRHYQQHLSSDAAIAPQHIEF